VTLTYGDSELTVQVDDDGCGANDSRSDGGSDLRPGRGEAEDGLGSGIAGMRERATALGGSLDAGPLPTGGFSVRARLPLSPGDRR
jgi:signal transduction histidine kinase